MNATEREKLYAAELGTEALARQRRATAPTCRGCNQPMRWVTVSTTNRKMPVDYDPHEAGNVIVYANDRADVYRTTPTSIPDGATLHFSHFATCPKAEQFRRR